MYSRKSHDLAHELLEERLVSHRAPGVGTAGFDGGGAQTCRRILEERSERGHLHHVRLRLGIEVGRLVGVGEGGVHLVHRLDLAAVELVEAHHGEVAAEQDLAGVAQVAEGVLVTGGDRLVAVDHGGVAGEVPIDLVGVDPQRPGSASVVRRWPPVEQRRRPPAPVRRSGVRVEPAGLLVSYSGSSGGTVVLVGRPSPRRQQHRACRADASACAARASPIALALGNSTMSSSGRSQPRRSMPRLARTSCWANPRRGRRR